MRYQEIRLVEGYREVTQKFSQEADLDQVKKIIAQYRDLVNRNQVQGNERNIDWWGKQGWERFRVFVNAKSQQQSQTQKKKRKNTGQSYTLAENDQWLIVVPLDKDASCFHGKGTDWCTTKPDHDYFEQYFLNDLVTLIYFLQKQTGAKWAAAVYSNGEAEFFDKNDNSISNGDLADQTGIPLDTVMKYVAMVSTSETDVNKKANSARSNMQYDLDTVRDLADQFYRSPSTDRNPKIETLLLKTKDSQALRRYMYKLISDDEKVDLDQNMQTLIATKLPFMIEHISNLSDRTARQAIKKDVSSLRYISNPSQAIINYAIKTDVYAIKYVENPTDQQVEYVLKQDPRSITLIKNPSEQQVKYVAAIDPMTVKDKKLRKVMNAEILATATEQRFKEIKGEDGIIDKQKAGYWVSEMERIWGDKLKQEFEDVCLWIIDKYEIEGARIIGLFYLMDGKIHSKKLYNKLLDIEPKFKSILDDLEKPGDDK